jgi:hypothetical protein
VNLDLVYKHEGRILDPKHAGRVFRPGSHHSETRRYDSSGWTEITRPRAP